MYLVRSEEHTSELQSHSDLVCRLLLEKKKKKTTIPFQLQPIFHISHLAPDNQHLDSEAMITNNLSHLIPPKPEHEDSVSMCSVSDRLGETTVPQSSQIFHSRQNTSDTGYQSQMTSTYCIEDMSSMQHEQMKQRIQSVNTSPSKSAQNEWEPPSSSTPNKNPLLNDDTHSSVWHQL